MGIGSRIQSILARRRRFFLKKYGPPPYFFGAKFYWGVMTPLSPPLATGLRLSYSPYFLPFLLPSPLPLFPPLCRTFCLFCVGRVHFQLQLYFSLPFVPSPTSSSVSLPLLLLGSRIVIISSPILFSSFPSSQSLSFSSDSFLLLLPFLFLSLFFSSSLSFFPPSFFLFSFSLLFPFLSFFAVKNYLSCQDPEEGFLQ